MIFAVKSDSGKAATFGRVVTSLKLSVVDHSKTALAGRSARDHSTARSKAASPDWMPWVMIGRAAARLMRGAAIEPSKAAAPKALLPRRKRRRERWFSARRIFMAGTPRQVQGSAAP